MLTVTVVCCVVLVAVGAVTGLWMDHVQVQRQERERRVGWGYWLAMGEVCEARAWVAEGNTTPIGGAAWRAAAEVGQKVA